MAIALLLCLCASGVQAQTQDRPFTEGPVWRVSHLKTRVGKRSDFLKYLQEHVKPVLDEEKRQGLILDYKYFSKPTSDGANDWDIALGISFRNYGEALDFNDDRSKKFDAINLKHYGSVEAQTKMNELRDQMRDVVSVEIMQEMILNPLK